MVATRRGTVVQPGAEPGEAAGQASSELDTSVAQSQTRGTKGSSQSEVGQDEIQLGDLHAAETMHAADTSEPLNLTLKSARTNRSRGEPQSDGEVSEAESTCSTLSGLHAPSITRTTRRRQIIINCPTDSIQKTRNRKCVSTARAISESQEETEVSEAESNCSSFSGIRMTNVSRRTRSRPSISRFPLPLASECQPEEVSDAESCCSNVSASQAANRVTRSRIAKTQTETIRQTQDFTSEFQTLQKNKPDDVSDAESWCSGISAGLTVRRLTRNSLAKSHNRTESQPVVRTQSQPVVSSELGSVEKEASDNEQTSIVSTRVSRSLRSRQPSQNQVELQSKSEVELQSGNLKQDETPSSCKVTEKRQTRAIASKEPPLENNGESDHQEEMLTQAIEGKKESRSKAAQLQGMFTSQPEHEDPRGSPAKKKKSPKKESTTILEPQQTSTNLKVTIDGDDDCEITKVIEADSDDTEQINVDLKRRAKLKRSADLRKLKAKQTSMLNKGDCFMGLLGDGEVSDTTSEDGEVLLVDNNTQKPLLDKLSEDMTVTSGNELFIIDTAPGLGTSKKFYIEQEEKTHDVESEEFEEEDPSPVKTNDVDDFIDEDENEEALLRRPKPGFVLSTAIDPGLNVKDIGGLYISFDTVKPKSCALKVKKKEELLKRSVITPDFEKSESVPPYSESIQRLKKKRKEERDKTTGDGWFGMRAPELTNELKNDLKALKMRSAIDPKRFYKKNDRDGFPKYFQVGTVVDSAVDFYHSRIPKKQRKKTIVEELLADSDFRRYNKKKYQQIMVEKAALAAGKKNRKKKKFRT